MNSEKASVTAQIVCAARSVGMSTHLRDPVAHHFATGWKRNALEGFGQASFRTHAARTAIRAASLGLVDHNTVRMLVVDQIISKSVSKGVRQVVILGAGLDSRAWRLEQLHGCHLFEVDHPASQAYKLAKSRGLLPARTNVHHVAADFTKAGELSVALLGSEYDPALPTCFICEGVTPYLDPASTGTLIGEVGKICASESVLTISYIQKTSARGIQRQRSLFFALAAKVGERAKGVLEPATIARYCEEAGLRPISDLDWTEWKRAVSVRSNMPNLLKERLLIATKEK